METLANLESFVRSVEHGSFSAAARVLALTPAAVSRNVAMLERNLGVRLFHRSTRALQLTEAGAAFHRSIGSNLAALQQAIDGVRSETDEPAGVLKVSLSPTFGVAHVLPLLPGFLARYPKIKPEWHFETRPVDLVAEGYDAALGGGFVLAPGVIAQKLAPAHLVAVAAPAYVEKAPRVRRPDELQGLDGIVMRSLDTGRIRRWKMRDRHGQELPARLAETLIVNDPTAARAAALLGLGVAMLALPDVCEELAAGTLVRLVPAWYADAGAICIYYSSRTLLAGKTRAFVTWVRDAFARNRLAKRFTAHGPPSRVY